MSRLPSPPVLGSGPRIGTGKSGCGGVPKPGTPRLIRRCPRNCKGETRGHFRHWLNGREGAGGRRPRARRPPRCFCSTGSSGRRIPCCSTPHFPPPHPKAFSSGTRFPPSLSFWAAYARAKAALPNPSSNASRRRSIWRPPKPAMTKWRRASANIR